MPLKIAIHLVTPLCLSNDRKMIPKGGEMFPPFIKGDGGGLGSFFQRAKVLP
jgi:hypothetical protein